jgi:hypothetical protein
MMRFRRYGLTPEEYEAMLAEQNGVCAICKRPPIAGNSLCVDHDHMTGRVRGLLCSPCNVVLGHWGDDPQIARHAAEYLSERQYPSDMSTLILTDLGAERAREAQRER